MKNFYETYRKFDRVQQAGYGNPTTCCRLRARNGFRKLDVATDSPDTYIKDPHTHHENGQFDNVYGLEVLRQHETNEYDRDQDELEIPVWLRIDQPILSSLVFGLLQHDRPEDDTENDSDEQLPSRRHMKRFAWDMHELVQAPWHRNKHHPNWDQYPVAFSLDGLPSSSGSEPNSETYDQYNKYDG